MTDPCADLALSWPRPGTEEMKRVSEEIKTSSDLPPVGSCCPGDALFPTGASDQRPICDTHTQTHPGGGDAVA